MSPELVSASPQRSGDPETSSGDNKKERKKMKKELIERLIGKDVKDISYWEEKYPPRESGKIVTRIAPSPTGFMHIGTLSTALINERLAHFQNGVFYLRIEDTDTKREVEGATSLVIKGLKDFDIEFDEGAISETEEKGAYAPYFQSKRADIYKSGIKLLLEKDLAYPCFCSEEELEEIRKEQMALKLRPGYYGKWAKYRNQTEEQMEENLNSGKPFILRFKSNGDWETKRYFEDLARGKIHMPENDIDTVILKSDGLPTYHFAHIMDDHLMGTTHVIRGDEWLASLPMHVQMFESIGWTPPHYAHLAPIQKLDEGNRRKLSKRKDPEANLAYYGEVGYPKEAVLDYLINLANSNFEDYKRENPDKTYKDFELKLENLNNSGPLLDFKKLENISKEFIATLSSTELFDRLYAWAKNQTTSLRGARGDAAISAEYLLSRMESQPDYIKSILAIERDGIEKVRKDFYAFSKIWDEISYFFDDSFAACHAELVSASPLNQENIDILIEEFKKSYNENHTKEEWFENIKRIAFENGYAKNPKEVEKNPGVYKGAVSDVATVLRLLITGRTQSPDLYAIMQILGSERVMKRLNQK